jgi:hypothetical protein
VKRLTIAISLTTLFCGAPKSPESTSSRDVAQTTATYLQERANHGTSETREPTSADGPSEREIYIDSITAANPLVVKGRARTFENTVSLRVRDAEGEVISEEHVTSVGEMGQHNPFEAVFWLVRDPGNLVIVEAFEYSAKDGAIQSLTRKEVSYRVETIGAKLVFPIRDCSTFGSFTRRVPKSVAMARLLSEALVGGPVPSEKAAGAVAPFPKGSDVRSVILRSGEVTVDFNDRLQNVGGSCAALAIRQSVVETLKQLPTVTRVAITAGGSRDLALQP